MGRKATGAKSYSTAQSQRGSLSSGVTALGLSRPRRRTRMLAVLVPKGGTAFTASPSGSPGTPKRARTACTSTSWSTMSRPRSAGCRHSALVASTMACRASGERRWVRIVGPGAERVLRLHRRVELAAVTEAARRQTLRGVSQRHTQRFPAEPTASTFPGTSAHRAGISAMRSSAKSSLSNAAWIFFAGGAMPKATAG